MRFHGVEPNRGAVFSFTESYGSERILGHGNWTVRCGENLSKPHRTSVLLTLTLDGRTKNLGPDFSRSPCLKAMLSAYCKRPIPFTCCSVARTRQFFAHTRQFVAHTRQFVAQTRQLVAQTRQFLARIVSFVAPRFVRHELNLIFGVKQSPNTRAPYINANT